MKKNENRKGHVGFVNQEKDALPTRGKENQRIFDAQVTHVPLSQIISGVGEVWKRRQGWHRAEKSLTLQCQALCRGLCAGDKIEGKVLFKAIENGEEHPLAIPAMMSIAPLLAGKEPIETQRLGAEKQLKKMAADLPGYKFCMETVGLSEFTIYALTGECPGINLRGFLDFDTPSRVWKRLGLAVMDDGTRQRKVAGEMGMRHGYNPARRSIVWTIGDSIIKGKGPYRKMYDDFKLVEQQSAEAKGLTILPAARITDKMKESGKYISEGHIHNRAKRKMEKAMVRDVWAAARSEARGWEMAEAA